MTSRTASKVVVRRGVVEAILDHAREGAASTPPAEVCGVLGGTRAGGGEGETGGEPDSASGDDAVDAAEPVPNVADDRRRAYELDPEATVETIDRLESNGLGVVGFYHSHPESDPVPSRADEARATWTDYVYLICNPDGRLNAYRWTGDRFEPLDVVAPDRD